MAMQHIHPVWTASNIEGAKMERVSDVIIADAQLAGCTTVADLYTRKPDVGSVHLGGNYVGPWYGQPTALMCIVGASFVARCCIVPPNSKFSRITDILLPHHATIADLKRELQKIGESIHPGVSIAIQHRELDALICRDSDGIILDDAAQLPKASASACADVRCHASFFFDMEPESMGSKAYIEERIKASTSAIARLRLGLGIFYRDANWLGRYYFFLSD